jgi:hypothetical protein
VKAKMKLGRDKLIMRGETTLFPYGTQSQVQVRDHGTLRPGTASPVIDRRCSPH